MPHPENLIDPLVGGTDGRGLFESLAGFTKPAYRTPGVGRSC